MELMRRVWRRCFNSAKGPRGLFFFSFLISHSLRKMNEDFVVNCKTKGRTSCYYERGLRVRFGEIHLIHARRSKKQ